MGGAKQAAPKRKWSPRSQRSLKREYELKQEIGKFENLIGHEERSLVTAEQNRIRQSRLVIQGQGMYQRALNDTLAEIEQRKQRITSYKDSVAQLRTEISALQPTAQQAAARAKTQRQLVRLATERVRLAASIDVKLAEVRALLKDRAALSAEMLSHASEIDFTLTGDFDSKRFDQLSVSLPTAMQPESKVWLEWFFGSESDRRACEIQHETESFPETLAAAHFYQRGEAAFLAEKQCAAANRPQPGIPTPMEVQEAVRTTRELPPLPREPRDMPGSGIIRA